jgi:hypothetical protein
LPLFGGYGFVETTRFLTIKISSLMPVFMEVQPVYEDVYSVEEHGK